MKADWAKRITKVQNMNKIGKIDFLKALTLQPYKRIWMLHQQIILNVLIQDGEDEQVLQDAVESLDMVINELKATKKEIQQILMEL